MAPFVAIPEDLRPTWSAIGAALRRVEARFDEQLRSDLPPVRRLCEHVERYRGKMLRPILVLASGLAAAPRSGAGAALGPDHVTVAAVCEMVHMATLVHDDVLDEAETRRRGRTINRLHGNEAAVILGDYLIASAYHLCSGLASPRIALLVARASTTMCTGELLQLHHRDDYSLDEATYFQILERKTAALIGLSCSLGAMCSGADESVCAAFERFGRRLGVAFQIQDDLLDLTGQSAVVGKTLGRDLGKGKLTLPMIRHLSTVPPIERGRALRLLERAGAGGPDGAEAAAELARGLEASGSVEHARRVAAGLVEEAKEAMERVPATPARRLLLHLADAVVTRAF